MAKKPRRGSRRPTSERTRRPRSKSRPVSDYVSAGSESDSRETRVGSRGGVIKTKGLSLSWKFAMVISLILIGILILQGVIFFLKMSAIIDEQINEKGVQIAMIVKNHFDLVHPSKIKKSFGDYVTETRTKTEEQIAQHKERKERFETANRELPDKSHTAYHKNEAEIRRLEGALLRLESDREQINSLSQVDMAHLNVVFYRHYKDIMKELGARGNEMRISGGFFSDFITNIIVFFKYRADEMYGYKKLEDSFSMFGEEGFTIQKFGAPTFNGPVKIENANVGTAGKTIPSRLFSLPLDGERGDIYIYMSLRGINEQKRTLLIIVVLLVLAGIIIGIGISFFLASLVTKPITQLVQDMFIVSQGSLNHKTRVQTRDEIGILAYTFNQMTRDLSEAQEREFTRKAMERDLQIAKTIQNTLLPPRIPTIKGTDICPFYDAAKEVGGDYYDFLLLDNRHLGIVVADVSGKGVPGSLVMTQFRTVIRLVSGMTSSPSDILIRTNEIIAKDLPRGMFVTAFLLIIDAKTRQARVCSAGHNPLVIYRAASNSYELANPPGIAVGFDKGTIFNKVIKEQEIQFGEGDRLVAYTDGVVECMSPKKEEFGDEKFFNLCVQNAKLSSKEFVQNILAALRKHQSSAEQHDDITIVTMSFS